MLTTKKNTQVKSISILIVEDEVIIAHDILEILTEVGYSNIYKARNYEQAIELLTKNKIDIALIDINLNSSFTGIQLANYINTNIQIPFLYVTSYSDKLVTDEAKLTKPNGFVLKPFTKEMLLASIEIVYFNFQHQTKEIKNDTATEEQEEYNIIINDCFLIKENYQYIKIPLAEIQWFESDGNYIEIKTLQKKYVIRCSLKKLQQLLPPKRFVKCYKKYIINIELVDKFSKEFVHINGNQIPVSRQAQSNVIKLLKS